MNLSLVLSWHEGFGLSAWEAIGASIPLILSRASGVYKLLSDIGGAIGCVTDVRVKGSYGLQADRNFAKEDVITVRNAIISVATRIKAKLRDAEHLRELLIYREDLTWEATARTFAEALGIKVRHKAARALSLPAEMTVGVEGTFRKFDSKHFDRTMTAATILFETGRYDSALNELETIPISGAPESDVARFNFLRSEAYLRLNNYHDAASTANVVIKYSESAEDWDLLIKAKGILNTLNRDQVITKRPYGSRRML